MVLSWRLSNTLDSSFCVDALEEAIAKYGCPEIFNTDQCSRGAKMSFKYAYLVLFDHVCRYISNVLFFPANSDPGIDSEVDIDALLGTSSSPCP